MIELEGHAPGGIFGRPATGPGRIQWTVEQETSRVLAPDNPFKQAAADEVGLLHTKPAEMLREECFDLRVATAVRHLKY